MTCESCGDELEDFSLCLACGLCAACCLCGAEGPDVVLLEDDEWDDSDMEEERYYWDVNL